MGESRKENGNVILKNTEGKNASEVAKIKELLEQQKAQKMDISNCEDLDNRTVYSWSVEGNLIKLYIDFNSSPWQGKVSVKEFEYLVSFGYKDMKMENVKNELLVSDCPKLETLNCSKSNLTKLDISNCPNLKELDCTENKLTKVDVSKCPKLRLLECSGNKITKVDVSKCPELSSLNCSENKLTKLDISKCPKLDMLKCSQNKLTKLDAGKCPKLQWLHCYNNNLAKLDVSKCPKVETLSCYGNKLTKVDVNKCPNLQRLRADKNLTISEWHSSEEKKEDGLHYWI